MPNTHILTMWAIFCPSAPTDGPETDCQGGTSGLTDVNSPSTPGTTDGLTVTDGIVDIWDHPGTIHDSQCIIGEGGFDTPSDRFCQVTFDFDGAGQGDLSLFAQKTTGSGQVKGVSALIFIEPAGP
jgi:hypothetical protein